MVARRLILRAQRRRLVLLALALFAVASVSCGSSDTAVAPPLEAPIVAVPRDVPLGDGEWWHPAVDASWQWQLQGPVNVSYDVDIYDIDLFDSDAQLIADLQAAGRHVVCYFSAGSSEHWRPDASRFAAGDLGAPLGGWEGERWLDIRSMSVRTVLAARLDLAVERGCDGVEPDNVQGYREDTGFDLSAEAQLAFNRWLADEAHRRGLAVGLKNDGAQVPLLVDHFDFALNEECHAFDECSDYAPFVDAGKPVLNAEYRDTADDARSAGGAICAQAATHGLRTLILPLSLDDEFRIACNG